MKKNTLVMITIRKILTLTLIVMAHTLFGQIVTEPTKVPIDQTLGKGSAMNNFSVATTSDLKGTMKQVKTIGQRDSILSSMRDIGMLCFVEDSGKMYQLLGGISNGDWQIFVTDSTGAVPTIPGGYPSTTLRRNVAGTAWVSDSTIYNNGALIGLKYGRLQIDTATVTSDSLNVLYNREGKLYWGGTDLTRRSGGSGLPDGDLNATLRNSTNNDSVWAASNALTNDDVTIAVTTGRLKLGQATVTSDSAEMLMNRAGDLYWGKVQLTQDTSLQLPYFNGSRSIKQTGWTGVSDSIKGGSTIQEFIEKVFFPFLPATISINGNVLYEVGTSNPVTVSGSTIAHDETSLTNGKVYRTYPDASPVEILSFGVALSYTTSVTFAPTQAGYTEWRFKAQQDAANNGSPTTIYSGTKYCQAVYPYLWGTSATDYSTGGSAFYSAMTRFVQAATATTNVTFNTSSLQYFYFAYPDAYADLTSIVDPTAPGTPLLPSFTKVVVSVSSSGLLNDWSAVNYKIYKSNFQINTGGAAAPRSFRY